MQERAGWCKPAGKGWLFYFMPGHSVLEFENPAYTRIIANAIVWRPQP
jgi:type 1 glutamine amidotransferase